MIYRCKYFEDNKSDELVTYSLVYDRNLNTNSDEELPIKVKTYLNQNSKYCLYVNNYKGDS